MIENQVEGASYQLDPKRFNKYVNQVQKINEKNDKTS